MKFAIHWLEFINPEHTCEELGIDSFEIDEAENPDNYNKVLKEILSGLPPDSKHSGDMMGSWEFECTDFFEVDNIEEAKKKAKEYECGDNGIFVVSNEQGDKLFDEQDVD